ncbi:MAG: M50 family metallopeptidase [Saprospiraceae bacterium]|nr:M50 family metallopeptidase [Lewinella sp.]
MKINPKNTKYLEWVAMAFLLFGTLRLSREWTLMENLKPTTPEEKYLMFAGIIVMIFVALAAHELGHLITGLLEGFRFELFVVGPLGIKRDGDQIKLYFNKNLGHYGGVAATSPVDDQPDNARKLARVLLAGPLASILFAVFCFWLANLAGKPLGFSLYTGGVISVAIFFATTVPSRTGMFFTDRKRYQRLVKPGKDQDVELAMLKILGRFSRDGSYKQVDQKDIELLVNDDLPFVKFMGLFNLICFQLEHFGEVPEDTVRQYRAIAGQMSKNVVLLFDREIENYREKFVGMNAE